MSDTKENTKENTKEKLRDKLRQSIEAKKIGRMNKYKKNDEIEKYYKKLGVTPEQVAEFQQLMKKQQNRKND